VRHGPVAQRRGERVDVALDDDVELAGGAGQQQVADGAADEVGPAAGEPRGLQQAATAGQLGEAIEQMWRRIVDRDSLSALRPLRPTGDRRLPDL
jgi:hypothetical protein